MKPVGCNSDSREDGQPLSEPGQCKSSEKVELAETSPTIKAKNRAGRQVRRAAEVKTNKHRTSRNILSANSKKLTICLSLWFAAVSILSPVMMNLHLTREVGLFMMEAELLELRLSMFNVIGSGLVLIVVHLILLVLAYTGLSSRSRRLQSKWTQKLLRPLVSVSALVSAISYLAMALTVTPIKQVTRVPYATFDCNANTIQIENCHQQFTTSSKLRDPSVWDQAESYLDSLQHMLVGDLNSQRFNERLINNLDCLKYSGQIEKPPTRFLLHHCGLVCKPNRQQVNQFSDDLNRDQLTSIDANSYPGQRGSTFDSHYGNANPPFNSSHSLNRASDPRDQIEDQPSTRNEVSLKVCFSDEFQQGPSYQQFCITNLANNNKQTSSINYNSNQLQDRALTVRQLNRVLTKMSPKSDDPVPVNQDDVVADFARSSPKASDEHHQQVRGAQEDQATGYVNPVVQFESHFRYNQLASNLSTTDSDPSASWCNLRPIPPFIVDNKPFSDIQCSIEHQYVMSTKTISARNKILFEKSSLASGTQTYESVNSSPNERCNIQCKVNILYQVYKNREASSTTGPPNIHLANEGPSQRHRIISDLHYYMPLKQCLIVSDEMQKQTSIGQYQFYRTLGDTSCFLIFILLDLLVLLESMDRRQGPFEGKRFRLAGLLFALLVVPLVSSVTFDLISSWSQQVQAGSAIDSANLSTLAHDVYPTVALANQHSQASSYISSFLKENLLVYLIKQEPSVNTNKSRVQREPVSSARYSIQASDRYIVSFVAYAITMFSLAYCASTLTPVGSSGSLIRSTSSEELGIRGSSHLAHTDESGLRPKKKQTEAAIIGAQTITSMEVIKLVLLTLILGTQFNLTFLRGHLQIFIESLGNPTDAISVGQSQFKLTKFIFETYSGTILVVLAGALIFSDEIISYTSSFSIFCSTTRRSIGVKFEESLTDTAKSLELSRQLQTERHMELNFYKFVIVSLAMYSFRGYLIANLNPSLSLKRLTVFFYHLIEMINLPITWLALTHRYHWLIHRYSTAKSSKGSNTAKSLSDGRERHEKYMFKLHTLVQSLFGIIYIALPKFLTLLLHSQFSYAYLHSDNVDWFIAAFYEPMPTATKRSGDAGNRNRTAGTSIHNTADTNQPETLFSPLPSEKQTYLHASKQFIKYNSLVCLVIIALSLVSVSQLVYNIWLGRLREKELLKLMKQQSRGKANSIDERLGFDLMRLHMDLSSSCSPQTAEVTSNVDISADNESDGNSESYGQPRAKVLFHYNVAKGRAGQASSTSSSTNSRDGPCVDSRVSETERIITEQEDASKTQTYLQTSPEVTENVRKPRNEIRIPIDLEQDLPELDDRQGLSHQITSHIVPSDSEQSIGKTIVESETIRQFKRIILVEDDENWPEVGDSREDLGSAAVDNTKRFSTGDNKREMPRSHPVDQNDEAPSPATNSQRKRTITFAAQPILIDPRAESSRSSDMQTDSTYSCGPCKHASPEPSICFDEHDEDEAR